MARADHDELACLTLEVQQQEKALAELGPELGKLEEQTQQSALTEQQLLAEKIAAEREWGPCSPNSNGRRSLDTRIRESSSNCRRSSRRGRRSGRCSSPWSRAGASRVSRWEQLRRQHQQWGAWLEEHKELAPVARQWQPLLTAMQDWAEDADRLQQPLPCANTSCAPSGSAAPAGAGQQERDYWLRASRSGCSSNSTSCRSSSGRAPGKAQEQWQQQSEQLGQLRQLLELADYGRNHGEQHGRLQQEIAQLEQALGKAGYSRRRAGAGP